MPSEVSCFRGIVRSAGWKEQRVTEELVRVAMGLRRVPSVINVINVINVHNNA